MLKAVYTSLPLHCKLPLIPTITVLPANWCYYSIIENVCIAIPVQAFFGRVQGGFPHPGHQRLQWSSTSDSRLSQLDQATSTPTQYEVSSAQMCFIQKSQIFHQEAILNIQTILINSDFFISVYAVQCCSNNLQHISKLDTAGQILIAQLNDYVLVKSGQIANPIIAMDNPVLYCSIGAHLCL